MNAKLEDASQPTTIELAERPALKPSFALLEEDSPLADAPLQPAPAQASPASSPSPETAAAPAATLEREPRLEAAAPQYVMPDLGATNPLAELPSTEIGVATSKALATDVATQTHTVSKVKIVGTAVAVVIAAAIGWTWLAPVAAPTASPLAQQAPVQAPTAQPGAQPAADPTAAAPASPGVGIDIGNTTAIALETGQDFDMIEQWAPVAPAQQSCKAQVLSPYLQAMCTAAGPARYFQCAPDGFHWDPRIAGCATF